MFVLGGYDAPGAGILLPQISTVRKAASGPLLWGVVILVVVCSALGWFLSQHGGARRTYRIGWQLSPPYQVATNGEPTGLSVDLVREAARRRGIGLIWILWPAESEAALRGKAVDLWPLITITPERLKAFHITEPYLQAEHTLLVRGDSSVHTAEDLADGSFVAANSSIDAMRLRAFRPNVRVLEMHSPRVVLEDVCQESASAGFMDVYTTISALLAQPDCQGHPLRWLPVPGAQTTMGVGSTFEASAGADAIREEIGVMAREGAVAPIVEKWGFTPAQSLVSLEELVDAKRRVARLAAATALFASLFALACWQAIIVMRERTRTKQTEKALREADQRLVLLANNLKEMVLAFDMKRNLIYVNPAVETLTGYSLAEYTARGFIDWVYPEDRNRMLGHWDRLFEWGSFQDEEYRLVTKSGAVKWVSATWGPILDDTGNQVGVQGIEHDITDRKCAEEALRQAQLRNMQSQKMESIGRLAGGVAHDFNNLLTVINGYAELLLLQTGPQASDRDPLEQILHAGTRAADLTRQLLAYSRKQVIFPQALDLNAVVTGSTPMFQRLLGEDIELVVKTEPSLGPVMAEAGQMHQVLMNLLVNARDAMPEGGKVQIETANVDIGASYVAGHPEAVAGPAVFVEVTDCGVGMDEETKKNIFEPFFTTKSVGAGTGLGLATVYGIVKQSQGWIELSSEPGRGTSFKIYLPRILSGLPVQPDARAGSGAIEGTETVLVVEDQDEVRAFAAGVLRSYGYNVLTAADGPKALALAAQHADPIHILLTDVVMPGMSGRQLADELRAQRPELRILYTSGYSQDVIANRGVLDADVAYLAKPYSPELLGVRLRQAIRASVSDENGASAAHVPPVSPPP
jgi:PAS domain S-box-containing protein